MKFWEAMKALDKGEEVRCCAWPKEDKCFYGNLLTALNSHNSMSYALEWELYSEHEQTLSFMEAVKGLKEGKQYRRKGWVHPVEGYNTRLPIRYIGCDDDCSGQKHFFCIEDFEATDWVEVK